MQKKAFVVFTLIMGLVLVGGLAAQTVKYEFKPPQNNFYIKWKEGGGINFVGYISSGLWRGGGDIEHFDTAAGKSYYKNGGKWYLDDSLPDDEVKDSIAYFLKKPDIISSYYDDFWERYNAAAGGTLKADLYHKGKERFLGINCDIFVDTVNNRYWIDPSNGCTLKQVGARGNVVYEVIEYNLNFTRWPAGLPPK